jgi:amyloid beta precursor protein binding protein 1
MGQKMDLRIAYPFPELAKFCDVKLESMAQEPDVLSHVPYIIILRKALESYMATHEGNMPRTYNEKHEQFP